MLELFSERISKGIEIIPDCKLGHYTHMHEHHIIYWVQTYRHFFFSSNVLNLCD